jgi:hypothetical protein
MDVGDGLGAWTWARRRRTRATSSSRVALARAEGERERRGCVWRRRAGRPERACQPRPGERGHVGLDAAAEQHLVDHAQGLLVAEHLVTVGRVEHATSASMDAQANSRGVHLGHSARPGAREHTAVELPAEDVSAIVVRVGGPAPRTRASLTKFGFISSQAPASIWWTMDFGAEVAHRAQAVQVLHEQGQQERALHARGLAGHGEGVVEEARVTLRHDVRAVRRSMKPRWPRAGTKRRSRSSGASVTRSFSTRAWPKIVERAARSLQTHAVAAALAKRLTLPPPEGVGEHGAASGGG